MFVVPHITFFRNRTIELTKISPLHHRWAWPVRPLFRLTLINKVSNILPQINGTPHPLPHAVVRKKDPSAAGLLLVKLFPLYNKVQSFRRTHESEQYQKGVFLMNPMTTINVKDHPLSHFYAILCFELLEANVSFPRRNVGHGWVFVFA